MNDEMKINEGVEAIDVSADSNTNSLTTTYDDGTSVTDFYPVTVPEQKSNKSVIVGLIAGGVAGVVGLGVGAYMFVKNRKAKKGEKEEKKSGVVVKGNKLTVDLDKASTNDIQELVGLLSKTEKKEEKEKKD